MLDRAPDIHPVETSWAGLLPLAANTIELVVFKIEEVWFGIPLIKVECIVDITNTQADFSALEHVKLLDLHERLFGSNLATPAAWTIFRDPGGCCYGIPVDLVPTLMLVPFDRIRLLPGDVRATSPLGIASHVATISESTHELTVFILADSCSNGRLT